VVKVSVVRMLVGTWKQWKVIYYANETQDNEGIVSKYPDNPQGNPTIWAFSSLIDAYLDLAICTTFPLCIMYPTLLPLT
jgi:hypothetical protein